MPNLAELTTATKVLLAAGLLLLIDLFLSWQKVCVDLGAFGGPSACGTRSGWHGVGIIVGLLVIALIAWEGLQIAKVTASWTLPVGANLISAGLAAAVLVFTIIKFLADNEARSWPSWVGLLLAIAVGVGGWLKYSEAPWTGTATQPPAAPPPSPPPPPAAPPQ
jgi:hypothetical protein